MIGILIFLIAIQAIGYICLQIPQIQTLIAKKAISYISNKIDGKIEINKVYIIFFNKIIVNDIAIVSTERGAKLDSLKSNYNQSDTLLSCKSLSIGFSPLSLLKLKPKIQSIELKDGIFNLQNEGENSNNLERIFKLNENKRDTSQNNNFSITVDNLSLSKFRFRLNNPDKYYGNNDSTINFGNLDVKNINIVANNIKFADGILLGEVKQLSAQEKSGLEISKLSCNLRVGKNLVMARDVYLKDLYSTINADYFSMKYKSAQDFSDFTNAIDMDVYFNNTFFSFKTLHKFTSTLNKNTLGLYLTGKAWGPVRNINVKSLQVTSETGQTYLNLKGRMSGLPSPSYTTMIIDINSCVTTSNDIARILSSLSSTEENSFIKQLTPFTQYKFNGSMAGLLNDFTVNGNINSTNGLLDVDVQIVNRNKSGYFINGKVKSYDLDIGKFISNDKFGKLTMDGKMSAEINNGIHLKINDININKIGINNYNYSNIIAAGEYTDNSFNGRILCKDPNLNFMFQGLFSLNNEEQGSYNFYANVPYANLAALNLDKRDSISVVSLSANADFVKYPEGDINGNIDVSNFTYTNSKGEYDIGNINLKSHQKGSDNYTMSLNSTFAEAQFSGTSSFISFINNLTEEIIYKRTGKYFKKELDKNVVDKKESNKKVKNISNPDSENNSNGTNNNYKFYFKSHESSGICQFISPGLYISPESQIDISIDNNKETKLKINSKGIAYYKNYIKDLNFIASTKDSLLTSSLYSSRAVVAGLKFDSTKVKIEEQNKTLVTSINFQNDTLGKNMANLNADIKFAEDKREMIVDIYNSNISVEGEKWVFKNSSFIYNDSSLVINNTELFNKTQSFNINGIVSKYANDSLMLNMNNFNISVFNMLLDKPFDIKGYFSGKATISSLKNNPYFYVDLNGDSVSVYNNPVGKMRLLSKWDQPKKRFNIYIDSKLDGKSNINANGYYKPDSSYIDINSNLNELAVGYFEPFLSDIISQTSGSLSGDIRLYGNFDKLKLIGEQCAFNNFGFVLNFTGVPYIINGPISLNENGLTVKNLSISDKFGSKGRVNGGVKYKYFKDIVLDTKISFTNMQCLNLKESDNEIFYGNAFATGNVNINGTINNINIGVNIRPTEKTALHIPLSNSITAGQTDLLTFKTKINDEKQASFFDKLLLSSNEEINKKPTELNISLQANLNPNANIFIEINKELGDVIKANGNGLINLSIKPSKQIFNIFGDYIINDGSYRFVLGGITSKDFIIQQGGKINFNGTIANTTLDLTAIYKTKASINTLIADTSSVSTRRNVDCELNITGNMTNPTLGFNINIPDLDPTTKMKVESALNTEGKIQKQFVALIVSGGFLPDESSGIANNSTIVYSNVADILSNQINNILQQLGIPLDLGLNYQQSGNGTDIFDVAVSTQLFNNRVEINGNIGNSPYANTNSSVIGNIDVEIKLDKNGKLRLNLFSHAPDQYSNYLDNSQRSGAGLLYQHEFNSIKHIFRRRPRSKIESDKIKRQERRNSKNNSNKEVKKNRENIK